MGDPGFPITAEAITPEWLTQVLRADGVLDGARVTAFTATPLGAGAGFMSAMRRIALTYDQPGCGGPATLIAKLPPPDPGSRAVDEAFNFYEKEVGFYRVIAPETPIRAPHAYFGAYAPESRDFALLLEDLTPLCVADQLDGLSIDQTGLALRSVAGMHARWWRDPALSGMEWLLSVDSPQFRQLQPVYQQCWPAVVDFLGEAMVPEMRVIGERFATRIEAMLEKVTAQPRTVFHGDFRADNLFFGAGSDAFAVADWQIVARGPCALDVAYLLTGSLDVDLRRRNEAGVLALYHQALCDGGVRDYPFEHFREDYRTCVMLAWCWPVVAIGSLDTANDRGVALFRTWADRAMTAIIELNAGDTIP